MNESERYYLDVSDDDQDVLMAKLKLLRLH